MNPFFNISEEEKKELIKHLETNFYEFKKNSSLLETIKN